MFEEPFLTLLSDLDAQRSEEFGFKKRWTSV